MCVGSRRQCKREGVVGHRGITGNDRVKFLEINNSGFGRNNFEDVLDTTYTGLLCYRAHLAIRQVR